jgi:cystathionine beta-lyase/cystathionine gamma-synthase
MAKFIKNAIVRTFTDASAVLMSEALKATVAVGNAEKKATNKWKVMAELMFSEGWTFTDINPETKNDATKTNRESIRAQFIEQWPSVKEKANLLLTGKALKALSESAKERNREIRQAFGPLFKNIEKYLKELEGIETVKVEDTDGKKLHKMIETAVVYAQGLESPSAQLAKLLDIIKVLKTSQGMIDLS